MLLVLDISLELIKWTGLLSVVLARELLRKVISMLHLTLLQHYDHKRYSFAETTVMQSARSDLLNFPAMELLPVVLDTEFLH